MRLGAGILCYGSLVKALTSAKRKSSADAVGQILDAINALLEYDSEIRILIETETE